MRSARLMMLVFVAVCLPLGLGCGKKKGGDSKKGDGMEAMGGEMGGGAMGGGEKGGGGGGLAMETKTLEFSSMKLTAQVPKGWKAQKFGTSIWYKPTRVGIYKSQLFVGETCQGDCSKVGENIKAQGGKQLEMHRGSFQDLKLVQNEATASGHVFHITMSKGGKAAHHYEVYYFKPGWSEAGYCRAMVLGDEVQHWSSFKAACDGVKVALKPKKK
ncbi:MAG: hypothetical protein ABI333_11430 [bacterium]